MQLVRDNIDFHAYMEEQESHRVHPASSWLEAVVNEYHNPQGVQLHPCMHWHNIGREVMFRPAEVSLWAGVNGHGKSMFLSQVTLDLITQGQRVMVASFEMPPARQMIRMSRQACAVDVPPKYYLERFHQWTDDKLWIYDHIGAVDWRKLLAVMRFTVKKYGIQHFVIDSLMKCVKGEDDYNGQKDFVNELCSFVQANNVHVHLVHHVRKGETEHKIPGKFDIRGASSITDQVDNVFIVWRNKMDENKRRPEDPDCVLACEKQRNGEKEEKYAFFFDSLSQQYLEKRELRPVQYQLK